jgi:outer membrane protein assembly factor BamB
MGFTSRPAAFTVVAVTAIAFTAAAAPASASPAQPAIHAPAVTAKVAPPTFGQAGLTKGPRLPAIHRHSRGKPVGAAARRRTSSGAADWPQFHYNAARTGYNPLETILSPANAPSLHLLWTASTDDAGTGPGSVSIANGHAFLGGFSPGNLWSWNTSDGSFRWKAPVDNILESTPAVGSGRAFIESNAGTLYAFATATGAELWSQPTGGAVTSPALVNGVVYAEGRDDMNAYSAATGTLLWSTTVVGQVLSNPAVAGGQVFVSSESRGLLALNAATGALLWARQIGSLQIASPAVGHGTVYQCSNRGLFAFGAPRGNRRWRAPGVCSGDATPAVANGVVYTAAYPDVLRAFTASTGTLLWTGGTVGTNFPAAPAVANGVVYAPAAAGTIAAYDTATHALLWTSPNLGLGESSPAVVNGRLYAADGAGLYAFGP